MSRDRVVFYDLETGGLKVGDPVIQIAAVAVTREGAALKEIDAFEIKIQVDDERCDQRALGINHYTRERWKDAVTETVAVAEFSSFLKEHATVQMISSRSARPYTVAAVGGYNITGFDTERLSALFGKINKTFLPIRFNAQLDVLQGAVWHFERHPELPKPTSFKQTDIAQYFGLDIGGAHDAMVDVRLCVLIAEKLLAG